jgi:NADPH:quinone reductase
MPKAIFLDALGGAENMRLGEHNPGAPAAAEALIRQTVMGVNYSDVMMRKGGYNAKPPFVMGREGIGVVEAVGAGVTNVKTGDRVGYTSNPGGYAEKRTIAADRLVAIPADIDDLHAMPLMMRGMTSHYLLFDIGRVGRGTTMLAFSAAGGVGGILCQWGRSLGATVIGCASGEEKRVYAKTYCDRVVGYDPAEIKACIDEVTKGKGVDVVFDPVGKDTLEISLASVRPRGMLALYGAASGPTPPFDLARLGANSLFLSRASLAPYIATREELLMRANAAFEAYRTGKFKLERITTFPLAEAAAAHRAIESRNTMGPIVLTA